MVAPVKAGDVLAQKYCVERILGIGGMGVVVAAEHVALHQKVALKFMLPDALADAGSVERFMREARAAVRLRSEHVARVMDVGCLENGAPYIVMEFLEGQDLEDVLRHQAPMPTARAVDILLQACMAMAEAHSIGIVHRDLKPANLFLTQRPDGSSQVKVLDFGISKVQGAVQEVSQTKSSMAMGSPGYMAPEQMRSAKHADHRADIWALGTILYKLLSNKLPFIAESAPEMFAAVLTGESVPLASVVPDVDPALAEVIHRCLERDRELRFASVAELASALAPFGDGKSAMMAASISSFTVAAPLATEPSAVELSAWPTVPMNEARPQSEPAFDSQMPATEIADSQPAAPSPSYAKNPTTTHRASAGQAVVAAPATDMSEPRGRGRLPLIAGVVGAAALALVATQVLSGGSGTATPTPAAQTPPVLSDAAPSQVTEAPAADAGATGSAIATPPLAADAAPATAALEPPATVKHTRRPKPASRNDSKPKPKPEVKPEPEPKPKVEPKPKPKPNDDPFGTMQ